jgi:hypothetical protein
MLTLELSTLAIALGTLAAGLNLYGLLKPAAFGAAARKFPRNTPAGWVLMLLGTAWFLYYVSQESVADFTSMKSIFYLVFGLVGIGACLFVQDFLAVRGLAVVLLLLAKLMVDTGRPHLGDTNWTLVIQGWAYVMVTAGIWFTVSPWKCRDLITWATASEGRIRLLSGVRLAFALLVLALGLTVFRAS